MKDRCIEITKDSAQCSTYEECRCENPARATASVREDGCDQLEDAENEQRAKCQTARQSQRESSITSSGDTVGSEPVDRSNGESAGDESSNSGPCPCRQHLHSLKPFSQNEKRV